MGSYRDFLNRKEICSRLMGFSIGKTEKGHLSFQLQSVIKEHLFFPNLLFKALSETIMWWWICRAWTATRSIYYVMKDFPTQCLLNVLKRLFHRLLFKWKNLWPSSHNTKRCSDVFSANAYFLTLGEHTMGCARGKVIRSTNWVDSFLREHDHANQISWQATQLILRWPFWWFDILIWRQHYRKGRFIITDSVHSLRTMIILTKHANLPIPFRAVLCGVHSITTIKMNLPFWSMVCAYQIWWHIH